jgi:hypothetical protein
MVGFATVIRFRHNRASASVVAVDGTAVFSGDMIRAVSASAAVVDCGGTSLLIDCSPGSTHDDLPVAVLNQYARSCLALHFSCHVSSPVELELLELEEEDEDEDGNEEDKEEAGAVAVAAVAASSTVGRSMQSAGSVQSEGSLHELSPVC